MCALHTRSACINSSTVHMKMKPRHANLPNHAHWSRPNTKYEIWYDNKRHLYAPYDYDNDVDVAVAIVLMIVLVELLVGDGGLAVLVVVVVLAMMMVHKSISFSSLFFRVCTQMKMIRLWWFLYIECTLCSTLRDLHALRVYSVYLPIAITSHRTEYNVELCTVVYLCSSVCSCVSVVPISYILPNAGIESVMLFLSLKFETKNTLHGAKYEKKKETRKKTSSSSTTTKTTTSIAHMRYDMHTAAYVCWKINNNNGF